MDEDNFSNYLLCFFVHLVLCKHAISFPTFSVEGSEKANVPSEFPYIRFGCGLSSWSTSTRDISFRRFQLTKDPAQRYLSIKRWLANIYFNNSLLQGLKTTEVSLLLPNVFTQLFMRYCCYDYSVLHLSSVPKTKW